MSAAVAAIQFALEDEDGIDFLRYWNEGEFDIVRRNWPDAPEAIYIGADPLHPATRNTSCTCPSGDGSLTWPCPVHPPMLGSAIVVAHPPTSGSPSETNTRRLATALELSKKK